MGVSCQVVGCWCWAKRRREDREDKRRQSVAAPPPASATLTPYSPFFFLSQHPFSYPSFIPLHYHPLPLHDITKSRVPSRIIFPFPLLVHLFTLFLTHFFFLFFITQFVYLLSIYIFTFNIFFFLLISGTTPWGIN